jgi:hypothetical protein
VSRVAATKPHLSFIKGYITEVSPLSTPEDIAYDILNVVIKRDGSVRRRLGVDYESGYNIDPVTLANEPSEDDASRFAIPIYEWTNVRNEGDKSYYVVQFGEYLYVFRAYESNVSSYLVGSVSIADYATTGNFYNAKSNPIWGQSIKGKFLVTGKYIDPFYIEELSTGVLSSTAVSIQIRDFSGVEDGLEETERYSGATLPSARRYNLQNAGWPTSFDVWTTEAGSGYTASTNTIDYTYSTMGVYPSITDTFSFFVESSPSSNTVNDAFNPFILNRKFLSTGVSPSGHYILDLFNQDRQAASGVGGVAGTTEPDVRFRLAVYYQGRVFYAGVDSDNIEAGLYFSQTLKDFNDIGKCYSINDPTDPFISDPLDTDGGFIPLSEAGKIKYLGVSNDKLVIGSESGIWIISGGDRAFSPTNYQVNKISSVNFLGSYSAVEVNSVIYFFGYNAIYSIGPNDFGNLVVTNISISTIQSHYDHIQQSSKEFANGVHDRVNNIIWWFYSSTTDGVTSRYYYDSAIVFDLNLNAFYKHSFSALEAATPYISGAIPTSSLGNTSVLYDVIVGTDDVVQGANDVVANISTPSTGGATPSLKLLTVVPGQGTNTKNITFSEMSNRAMVDWATADGAGADYSSYAETAFENLGDFGRDKQALTLQTMFQITEDGFEDDGSGNIVLSNQSGCKLTAKWDYSNSASSNRWHVIDEIYRLKDLYVAEDEDDPFDYGYLVNQNKIAIRGMGKVLQYRFESVSGKDFHLLGWETSYAVNSK